jgi:hypothetical protein
VWTDWAKHARPTAEVLSSFEHNELRAQLDDSLPLRPQARHQSDVHTAIDYRSLVKKDNEFGVSGRTNAATRIQIDAEASSQRVPPQEDVITGGPTGSFGSSMNWHSDTISEQTNGNWQGVHLRIELCGLRLQGSLNCLEVAFRLGAAQQVSAFVSEQRCLAPESNEVCGTIGSSAISASPIWQVDSQQYRVNGPSLAMVHVHLWRRPVNSLVGALPELVGLAKIPLPVLAFHKTLHIANGGCVPLMQTDVEICSVSNSGVIGSIRVVIHAGRPNALAQAPLAPSAMPVALAPQSPMISVASQFAMPPCQEPSAKTSPDPAVSPSSCEPKGFATTQSNLRTLISQQRFTPTKAIEVRTPTKVVEGTPSTKTPPSKRTTQASPQDTPSSRVDVD